MEKNSITFFSLNEVLDLIYIEGRWMQILAQFTDFTKKIVSISFSVERGLNTH